MERSASPAARIAAAIALVLAVIVVVAVVASQGGDSKNASHKSAHHKSHEAREHRTKAKTYVVQTGDTLTAIAHETGVPVAEILALNPEVDPQILIAGQTLKLR
jgi:LysM repeat protein